MFKKKFIVAAFALAAILAVPMAGAFGQAYPSQQPVYIPNGVLAAQTLVTTTSTTPFVVQGQGALAVKIAGTFSVLAAKMQGTVDPVAIAAGSATWVDLTAYLAGANGAQALNSITAAGTYRVDAAGYTRVRLNVTSLTGTNVIATMVATPPQPLVLGRNSSVTALTFTNGTATSLTTTNSADFINDSGKGVTCTYYQTGHTNTVSVAMNIQSKDVASGAYSTILALANMTTDSTVYVSQIYPGMQTSSLPTNMSGLGIHLPRVWRVQTVQAAGTGAIAATVGCDSLN